MNLPSKEGLNVNAEISILYHVKQEKTIDIINEVGVSFERVLILEKLSLSLIFDLANIEFFSNIFLISIYLIVFKIFIFQF